MLDGQEDRGFLNKEQRSSFTKEDDILEFEEQVNQVDEAPVVDGPEPDPEPEVEQEEEELNPDLERPSPPRQGAPRLFDNPFEISDQDSVPLEPEKTLSPSGVFESTSLEQSLLNIRDRDINPNAENEKTFVLKKSPSSTSSRGSSTASTSKVNKEFVYVPDSFVYIFHLFRFLVQPRSRMSKMKFGLVKKQMIFKTMRMREKRRKLPWIWNTIIS